MHSDDERIAAELVRIPGVEAWPGIDAVERERRARIVADIRRRVVENGPREPLHTPDRGRLFMPFAALKGYDSLVEQEEDLVAADDA